jgi:8-oxo-dGTP pyrophosphatase MutT (NUDIX family)
MKINTIFDKYIDFFPQDEIELQLLKEQLSQEQDLFNRKNFIGHLTASGFILSKDMSSILLIHHNFLNKYLQPGGHCDDDNESPLQAAEREIEEETGLTNLELLSVDVEEPLTPIQIHTHPIPTNPAKAESAHFHHDFRYCFHLVDDQEINLQENEVGEAKWFTLDELQDNPDFEIAAQRIRMYLLDRT